MSRVVSVGVIFMLACTASPLSAQEPAAATYDGTWSARLQGNDGKRRDATVIIAGYDGTWQDRTGGPASCGGRKMPITFQSSRRTVVAFTVWGEKAGANCPNLSVLVKPAGAKVLQGIADVGVSDRDPAEAAPASAASGAAGAMVGTAGSIRLTRR